MKLGNPRPDTPSTDTQSREIRAHIPEMTFHAFAPDSPIDHGTSDLTLGGAFDLMSRRPGACCRQLAAAGSQCLGRHPLIGGPHDVALGRAARPGDDTDPRPVG